MSRKKKPKSPPVQPITGPLLPILRELQSRVEIRAGRDQLIYSPRKLTPSERAWLERNRGEIFDVCRRDWFGACWWLIEREVNDWQLQWIFRQLYQSKTDQLETELKLSYDAAGEITYTSLERILRTHGRSMLLADILAAVMAEQPSAQEGAK